MSTGLNWITWRDTQCRAVQIDSFAPIDKSSTRCWNWCQANYGDDDRRDARNEEQVNGVTNRCTYFNNAVPLWSTPAHSTYRAHTARLRPILLLRWDPQTNATLFKFECGSVELRWLQMGISSSYSHYSICTQYTAQFGSIHYQINAIEPTTPFRLNHPRLYSVIIPHGHHSLSSHGPITHPQHARSPNAKCNFHWQIQTRNLCQCCLLHKGI